MRDEENREVHEVNLSELDALPAPAPGDTDKLVLVTGHHPDEATVELSVFRPEPQTIVLLKSELPFVVGALQDYIKD